MPPLVSVTIPTLNQAAFLPDCLHSLFSQDYPSVETFVVDGGSTDGTNAILQSLSGCVDWISERDEGMYDAVNKGWRRANGEYLGYLNSDDMYCEHAISNMVAFLEQRREVQLVFGDFLRIGVPGRSPEVVRLAPPTYEMLLKNGNTIFTGAMLVRRSLLDDVGLFDTHYKYAADYDFCIRVARNHSMGHVPEPLSMFRIHGGSKSQASRWKMWQEVLDISLRHSGERYVSLYSRHLVDRAIHIIPEAILWKSELLPLRRQLRRIWGLGR